MSVFPAASASLVPAAWAQLMTDPVSLLTQNYLGSYIICLPRIFKVSRIARNVVRSVLLVE